ncbi:glycosyltransferase [uncultured Dysgonomonas sp.]|uniref:glycosyltransferase n=1 Tax=uncultured Dysgonomonas sp. TaxID=206096 RepID=UPI0026309C9D|nr:glycosyltransferase [uncultured Dysgonomonas sp.]
MRKQIALIHPIIAHYREEFFQKLNIQISSDVYVFEDMGKAKEASFFLADAEAIHIKTIEKSGFTFFSPFPLLSSKYNVIVLMWNFSHLTNWILLMTKFIHRKKIILWGHGISVKRYLLEEKHPDWKLKAQLCLADGAWTYMPKESEQWKAIFTHKKIAFLNNTISGVADILKYDSRSSKEKSRIKHKIAQNRILLFCARFENPNRRIDLLLKTIEDTSSDIYGFIIIGDGKLKPDFSQYNNVYDYGAVYDENLKRELFSAADIYFQPGWVGLSIVEAMAYSLPIFTFKRSSTTLQCVEYSYIIHQKNGLLLEECANFVAQIDSLSDEDIEVMGNNARSLIAKEATMKQMVDRAVSVIDKLIV